MKATAIIIAGLLVAYAIDPEAIRGLWYIIENNQRVQLGLAILVFIDGYTTLRED